MHIEKQIFWKIFYLLLAGPRKISSMWYASWNGNCVSGWPPKRQKTEGFYHFLGKGSLKVSTQEVPPPWRTCLPFLILLCHLVLGNPSRKPCKCHRFVHFCPPAFWTNLSGKTAGIDAETFPKPVRGGPLASANIFYVIPSGSDLQIASLMWFNSWISSILVSLSTMHIVCA